MAVTVATVVDALPGGPPRRRAPARRRRCWLLVAVACSPATAAASLLEQIREAFGLRAVTMVEHTPDGDRSSAPAAGPVRLLRAGRRRGRRTDTLALRLSGRALPASERRVLVAFAEQAAVALQQGRLSAQAAEADRLGGRQQHAHGPARRREPRPAHPAGRYQGRRVCAARRRHRPRRGRPGGAGGDDRRVGRPAHRPGREPARHEPPAGGRGQPGADAADTPASWCRALSWLDAAERAASRWTGRTTCPRPRRPRPAGARGRQPRRATRCATPRPVRWR